MKQEIKDWASLLEFIVSNYPARITESEIVKEMGISEGSYFPIKNGTAKPGTLLQRRILEFVKKKFGLDIEVSNDKVSIKNSNVLVKSDNNTVAGRDVVNEKDFLIKKLFELTIENERLKMELEKRN